MGAADIKAGVDFWTVQPRIWRDDGDGDIATEAGTEEDQHYAMSWTKTECSQDEHNGVFEALAMTFGIAIFITNLIVVAAIKRGGRKLHKATFYCICNLAVADMLAGLLLLWVFGLQRVILSFRTAQSELVQKSVWTLTVWTSLMSQVVIAVDRYSHVTRGSKGDASGCDKWGNKQRRRMVIIGILLTWLIPTFTYVIPVMTVWNCAADCSCYVKHNNTDVIYMTCFPIDDCSQVNPPFTKSSMLFLSLILLLLPFVPVVLYLKIFFFVRNSSKNLSSSTRGGSQYVSGSYTDNGWHTKRGTEDSHGNYSKEDSTSRTEPFLAHDEENSLQQTSTTNGAVLDGTLKKSSTRRDFVSKSSKGHKNGNVSKETVLHNDNMTRTKSGSRAPSTNHAFRKRSQRRDMRLLRTLVIILGLFVISTVPLGVLFVVSLTEQDKRYVIAAKYLLTLSLLNSLINPWVYFWRFREMRAAIRRLFCSPCSDDHRSMKPKKRREDQTCVCCHLPQPRKLVFSSQHSAKKATSSSSSSAF